MVWSGRSTRSRTSAAPMSHAPTTISVKRHLDAERVIAGPQQPARPPATAGRPASSAARKTRDS